MSAIGLDHPHIEEHFNEHGMCQCPCSECTARTSKICWCEDCPCMCTPGIDHGRPLDDEARAIIEERYA